MTLEQATDWTSRADQGFPAGLRLQVCPRCEYSLIGLPLNHRCPECGFEYDERTFVLAGISRGTTSIRLGRRWLWILVAIGSWLGFSFSGLLIASSTARSIAPAIGVVWLGLVLYLVFSSRGERKGIEYILFAPAGFGYVADVIVGSGAEAHLISWPEVDTVIVDRKSAHWHRIRIGSVNRPGGRLKQIRLDVGVHCDEPTARWVRNVLADRITAARAR